MEKEPRPPACSGCLRDPQINICPQCEHTSTSATDPDQAESLERADPDHVASVIDRLERTDLQTDEAEGADARTAKAMKSCQGCSASRCDAHLKASADLRTGEAQTCSRHDRPLEVYCRSAQMCVCFLCVLDERKGHDVVSVASGRAEKQTHLEETVKKVTDRETELNDVKTAADILMNLSEATTEAGERIFTELMDFIQTSHTEAMTLIQNHMRAEMNRIHRHVEGLEENISELKSEHSELRRLSDTEHHVSYLQKVLSSQRDDFSSRTINPQFSFGEVIKSLSSLTQQTRDIWTLEIRRISSAVKRDQILLPSEPKTREDFLQFLVPLSLDPNTAHRNLGLIDQNRAVACSTKSQSYPEHPERFQWWAQVLTSEGLTGRCYWEVIWTGLHGVDVAVAYKDIKRTGDGDDSGFGYNRYSWSLDCSEFRCVLVHDNTETEMTGAVSHRIGVFLDHRAGLLSFYSITDTMTLLHRVHSHFTQPLYPGFGLFQGSSLILCGPEFNATPQKQESKKKNYDL